MNSLKKWKPVMCWGLITFGCVLGILNPAITEEVEAKGLGGPTHIGTFEGSTTFTTSSSNGINPGLYLEVMDEYGNYHEYTSDEGVITIPNTKEGAYVTQAKLLGKTKYVDQDTGEILDEWEPGRNLTLESSKMPALKTRGKNLFNADMLTYGGNNYTGSAQYLPDTSNFTRAVLKQNNLIEVKPNSTLTLSCDSRFKLVIQEYDENEIRTMPNDKGWQTNGYHSLTVGANTKKVNLYFVKQDPHSATDITSEEFEVLKNSIQLEEGSVATSFESFKSSILTVNEEVELRGIGDVRDELNLLTGELVQRVGEITMNGGEAGWGKNNISSNREKTSVFTLTGCGFNANNNSVISILSNSLKSLTANQQWSNDVEGVALNVSNTVLVSIDKNKLESDDLKGFKAWLSKNPIKIQAQLARELVKAVDLTSTYYFQPVMNRSVEINGTVLPLVYSVTVPTEPLSFVLNPNAEEGQQFIAPMFTVTNESPASIQVEINTFEQTTQVFHDVLPTKYSDWSQLTREQSKDFALAVLPIASDGWETLIEGPRYVADPSNYHIGEIKAESSVEFGFAARHGRAFMSQVNPQYRLSFIFGF